MVPAILNESGEELEGPSEGYLVRSMIFCTPGERNHMEHRPIVTDGLCPLQVFKQPWPGVMRTVYGNHLRFETTYFKKFPGYYVTGDGESDDWTEEVTHMEGGTNSSSTVGTYEGSAVSMLAAADVYDAQTCDLFG